MGITLRVFPARFAAKNGPPQTASDAPLLGWKPGRAFDGIL